MRKALIFAAGRGKRMGELTNHTPKPLLQVQGKPLIEHTIDRLKKAGLTDIVINIAYLGAQIKNFIGDGRRWGINITFSEEPYPLETGGGILNALPLLGDEPFVVANADVITDFPMEQLRDHKFLENILAHLIMVPNPSENPDGDFSIDARGLLQEKTAGKAAYTYSGLSLIDPKFISTYPARREKFPLLEVFRAAIKTQSITAQLYQGLWKDVGTPERLEEF